MYIASTNICGLVLKHFPLASLLEQADYLSSVMLNMKAPEQIDTPKAPFQGCDLVGDKNRQEKAPTSLCPSVAQLESAMPGFLILKVVFFFKKR